MRVLFLSHSSAVENLGGAERAMLDFIDSWRRIHPDAEMMVVSRRPHGLLQPQLTARGIPTFSLTFQSWVLPRRIVVAEDVFRTAREDFVAVKALERVIEQFRPDLVVTNTIVAPWAAVAARLQGVPHVWFAHEFGSDHEFALSVTETFTDIGLLSDMVVCSSRELREYLAEWVPREKLEVLYQVPSVEIVDELRRHPLLGEVASSVEEAAALRVVLVGRIVPSKGQWRLVEAIQQLASEGVLVEAAVVGTGAPEALAGLTEAIRDAGLADRITLVGEVENPYPHIDRADVAVVISDSEGFGRVTVEYLASGTPVIAARVGASVELVEHEVTGLLIDAGDIGALASALRRYATEPALLHRHGLAARRHFIEDISARHPVEELLARFDSLGEGSTGMEHLPNLLLSWMSLPDTSMTMLAEAGMLADPKEERTWRVGAAALSPLRLARNLWRRGR